jgi:hypothetical protein
MANLGQCLSASLWLNLSGILAEYFLSQNRRGFGLVQAIDLGCIAQVVVGSIGKPIRARNHDEETSGRFFVLSLVIEEQFRLRTSGIRPEAAGTWEILWFWGPTAGHYLSMKLLLLSYLLFFHSHLGNICIT